jgi:hypothetical protein
VYALEKMEELGFYYESIGRKIVNERLRNKIDIRSSNVVRERGIMD